MEPLTWRSRPADKDPQKLWVIGVVAVVALVLGFALFRNVLLGLLGFAIILGSTAEFWLGSLYRLDEKGVSARVGLSTTSMAWEDVKRVLEEADGVKLSPLAEPGRLDPFRGVKLRFGTELREKVYDTIRRYCPNDVRFLEG